jgi:hypothetical protein
VEKFGMGSQPGHLFGAQAPGALRDGKAVFETAELVFFGGGHGAYSSSLLASIFLQPFEQMFAKRDNWLPALTRRPYLRGVEKCDNISSTQSFRFLRCKWNEEPTSWFSPNLQMEMPLVAYGQSGQTLLMLPTAAADYLEYERFYLVDSIKPFIEAGKIRAYSINSVNKWSLLNKEMPPKLKAELLTRYDRYITEEVLPLIPE